ncbi:hypothetical protein WH47_05425 [Habropoda laboriosa]|uniref:DUF7041 domain-containing protein n=2 Tax=Habropoda laboriosa TaxID=597456 RepID=A0A0L7QJ97_9HYME|nr:hypothetical protein WH47_05425 [Habropoda laboriosa]
MLDPVDPKMWFQNLEAQFAANNIDGDATKFWFIVTKLGPMQVKEITDIVNQPPKENMYSTLKKELIRRLSTAQVQRISHLLEREEVGNRTPSQFLKHMRTLAGQSFPEDKLRSIWISRLPVPMQDILATQNDVPLKKVAVLANKLLEKALYCQKSQVNDILKEIEALRKEIVELRRIVEEVLRGQSSSVNPARQGTADENSSTAKVQTKMMDAVCWYHQKFGKRSTRCIEPCDFPMSSEADRS